MIGLAYPPDPAQLAPPDAARKAEIDRIIAQRMAEMRAEAAKAQDEKPAD